MKTRFHLLQRALTLLSGLAFFILAEPLQAAKPVFLCQQPKVFGLIDQCQQVYMKTKANDADSFDHARGLVRIYIPSRRQLQSVPKHDLFEAQVLGPKTFAPVGSRFAVPGYLVGHQSKQGGFTQCFLRESTSLTRLSLSCGDAPEVLIPRQWVYRLDDYKNENPMALSN